MDVVFPDGTVVRASSLSERVEHDPTRSFGLYLDMRWLPTWPAEVVEWPDFGLPADPGRAADQIVAAFERARRGDVVEVGCVGGLGRTGTVLACMAVLAGEPPSSAVDWVRREYDPAAVETIEQEHWVRWFADRVSGG
jgi:hypothetical protein